MTGEPPMTVIKCLPLPEGEGRGKGEPREMPQHPRINERVRTESFQHSVFGFLSIFGFRISDLLFLLCFLLFTLPAPASENLSVLKSGSFAHYIEHFNSMEDENVTNFVSNAESWDWLRTEIPFFECPDREVEEMYYYRWWSFRKHLESTPDGFVFSEFLTRPAPISSALGHHLMEGRWLHDQNYLDDYVRYWFRNDVNRQQLHKYSSWLADALYQRYLVVDDQKFLISQLNDLVRDYEQWEQERLSTNGLFWQYDVRDAMEESISGSRTNRNLRPTINSYMYGNARAIANIARLAGNQRVAAEFDTKADQLRHLVEDKLWNPEQNFFEVLRDDGKFSNAREEIGFIPWYFELPQQRTAAVPGRSNVNGQYAQTSSNAGATSPSPIGWERAGVRAAADPNFEIAWTQLPDAEGFHAAYGITTAERRHPLFRSHGYGHCEWDGAVWPFATSQTLDALANVLRDYNQSVVSSRDYFDAFLSYVHSQHADGKPYIGEYLDETTGHWINGKGERSRYYNHSTFADLIITGVVGLRPRPDNAIELFPLLPSGTWDWFCLDGVKYHGRTLTILWDKDGTRYHRGSGLIVLSNGKQIMRGSELSKTTGELR